MRPARAPENTYPGTAVHDGRGYCRSCRTAKNRDGTWSLLPELEEHLMSPMTYPGLHDEDPEVSKMSADLKALIDNRRRRGIPTKGIGT